MRSGILGRFWRRSALATGRHKGKGKGDGKQSTNKGKGPERQRQPNRITGRCWTNARTRSREMIICAESVLMHHIQFSQPLEQRICGNHQIQGVKQGEVPFGHGCSRDSMFLWIWLTTDLNKTRHKKGNITDLVSIPDFGRARLKCTDELDVNKSITDRCTDVRKILASAPQIRNKKQCLWFDGSRGYIVPQDGAIGRGLPSGEESSDPTIRTKDGGSCVPRKQCVQVVRQKKA